MGAKIIAVSADDITYYTLPGSTGDISRAAGTLEDTIFGQSFKSMQPGVIGWQVSANAYFKGYPGYVGSIKKPGTPTVMTTEACTLVSGKTYQINNAAKRTISRADALTVYDNAVAHNADVLNVDYLTGQVTFAAAYTVVGPVTITGKYLPLVSLGKYTSYNLTQSAVAIKDSNIPDVNANGGFDTFRSGGLRDVTMSLPAIFAGADAWDVALTARAEYLIELNPDGVGSHYCRGFFRLFDNKQQGAVGALEEQTLQFNLTVPVSTGSALTIAKPFTWVHAAGGPLPTAIKTVLDAWINEQPLYVKYLHDGTSGWKGAAVVTNVSLAGGLDSVNQFTCSFQGSGAPTVI